MAFPGVPGGVLVDSRQQVSAQRAAQQAAALEVRYRQLHLMELRLDVEAQRNATAVQLGQDTMRHRQVMETLAAQKAVLAQKAAQARAESDRAQIAIRSSNAAMNIYNGYYRAIDHYFRHYENLQKNAIAATNNYAGKYITARGQALHAGGGAQWAQERVKLIEPWVQGLDPGRPDRMFAPAGSSPQVRQDWARQKLQQFLREPQGKRLSDARSSAFLQEWLAAPTAQDRERVVAAHAGTASDEEIQRMGPVAAARAVAQDAETARQRAEREMIAVDPMTQGRDPAQVLAMIVGRGAVPASAPGGAASAPDGTPATGAASAPDGTPAPQNPEIPRTPPPDFVTHYSMMAFPGHTRRLPDGTLEATNVPWDVYRKPKDWYFAQEKAERDADARRAKGGVVVAKPAPVVVVESPSGSPLAKAWNDAKGSAPSPLAAAGVVAGAKARGAAPIDAFAPAIEGARDMALWVSGGPAVSPLAVIGSLARPGVMSALSGFRDPATVATTRTRAEKLVPTDAATMAHLHQRLHGAYQANPSPAESTRLLRGVAREFADLRMPGVPYAEDAVAAVLAKQLGSQGLLYDAAGHAPSAMAVPVYMDALGGSR